MYCNKCGKELADDTVFCPSCGKRVKEEKSSEKISPVTFVIVAVTILIVAAAITVLVLHTGKKPERSVENEVVQTDKEQNSADTPSTEKVEDEPEIANDPDTADIEKPEPIEDKDRQMEDFDWRSDYLDYIEKTMSFEDRSVTSYKLAYIDEDDVPELFICYGSAAGGTQIATCHNGEINTIYSGEYGPYYIEKGKMMLVPSGNGEYKDEIVSLENGAFTVLATGVYSYLPEERYQWEGEEMPYKEYERHLKNLFDTDAAVRLDSESGENIPYSELTDYLEKWEQ